LLGCYEGTSIIDVTNPSLPVEVAFISGPYSVWRDIKTHSYYAYVTHDANANQHPNPGVQIIDLSSLPATATLANTYNATIQGGLAHNLYIDDGYAYIAGSRNVGGVHILDLSNPIQPVEVGAWAENYWHDVIVKNDTLYGSAMSVGAIEIVDGRDKANLKLISRTFFPDAFTHNIWMTEDNKYLSQTDEVHNQPLNFWDVSNHLSPELVATYHAGAGSIAHNTHLRDNFAFVSYYYDGLKVIDISQRRAPVEVGHYDTYPDDNFQRGGGYEGAWGAYPFLPSGIILVSDITYGLNAVQFDGTRAGFVRGLIRDTIGNPIGDVKVQLLNPDAGDGKTDVKVGIDGAYTIGAKPGSRRFRFSKFGYYDALMENVNIQAGVVIQSGEIQMLAKPYGTFNISAKTQSNAPIFGATIFIETEDYNSTLTTDANGNVSLALPIGAYKISFSRWGYLPQAQNVELLSSGPTQVSFVAVPGYVETFTNAQTWSLSDPSDQSISPWLIDKAENRPYGSRLPAVDHTGDADGFAAHSRARFGASTLTSPEIDATILTTPYLQFARYYNPYGWASIQANDTLKVLLSNNGGSTWTTIDAYTTIDEQWQVLTYRIADYLTPSNAMKVRFVNVDGEAQSTLRTSSFCMLDDIKIVSEGTITNVDETSVIPASLQLFQNYPNPFNPSTTIRWSQPRAGIAEVAVFNLLGQRIEVFKTENLRPGEHRLQVNLNGHASGIYFYQVRVNGITSTVKKMLLVR
jgi:choice-of-anchor B domain-containing protein